MSIELVYIVIYCGPYIWYALNVIFLILEKTKILQRNRSSIWFLNSLTDCFNDFSVAAFKPQHFQNVEKRERGRDHDWERKVLAASKCREPAEIH